MAQPRTAVQPVDTAEEQKVHKQAKKTFPHLFSSSADEKELPNKAAEEEEEEEEPAAPAPAEEDPEPKAHEEPKDDETDEEAQIQKLKKEDIYEYQRLRQIKKNLRKMDELFRDNTSADGWVKYHRGMYELGLGPKPASPPKPKKKPKKSPRKGERSNPARQCNESSSDDDSVELSKKSSQAPKSDKESKRKVVRRSQKEILEAQRKKKEERQKKHEDKKEERERERLRMLAVLPDAVAKLYRRHPGDLHLPRAVLDTAEIDADDYRRPKWSGGKGTSRAEMSEAQRLFMRERRIILPYLAKKACPGTSWSFIVDKLKKDKALVWPIRMSGGHRRNSGDVERKKKWVFKRELGF